MAIEASHRAAVFQETMVSGAINALLPTGTLWLLNVAPPLTVLGERPLIQYMLPAAGVATFMMTLVVTTITRMRVRKGGLPALDWPREDRGMLRFIPRNILLRAIVLGLVAIIIFVPLGVLAVALLDIVPMTQPGFLVFNLVFGGIVGMAMARFVVLPALADPLSRQKI